MPAPGSSQAMWRCTGLAPDLGNVLLQFKKQTPPFIESDTCNASLGADLKQLFGKSEAWSVETGQEATTEGLLRASSGISQTCSHLIFMKRWHFKTAGGFRGAVMVSSATSEGLKLDVWLGVLIEAPHWLSAKTWSQFVFLKPTCSTGVNNYFLMVLASGGRSLP